MTVTTADAKKDTCPKVNRVLPAFGPGLTAFLPQSTQSRPTAGPGTESRRMQAKPGGKIHSNSNNHVARNAGGPGELAESDRAPNSQLCIPQNKWRASQKSAHRAQ